MKNRIRISATEAARSFSALLDRVAGGSEATIERHAEPVALLTPVESAPRRLSDCIGVRISRSSSAPDSKFHDDLTDIIRGHPTGEPPAWD